jgi:hypothetical protein
VITPGLFRHALRRSLRWRVLLVFWGALLLPSALALLPAFAFLRGHLDHSTRAQDVVAWMDGATAIDLVLQLGTDSAARRSYWG